MTFYLLAFLASFVLALAILPGLIRLLTRRHVEQVISEDVPEHMGKKGTPTLGGIGIVIPATLVTLIYAASTHGAGDAVALVALLLVTSLLGFADDLLILRGGRNAGQKWSHKLGAQVVVAGAFVIYLWVTQGANITIVHVPGLGREVQLGWIWAPLAVIYLAGMSNAVNLSDGLDGLAGGLSIIAALSCAAAASAAGAPEVTVFLLALAGACLGFLWFNSHPAQIFMGNTSSIALGMVLAGAALITRYEIVLVLSFGVFAAEAISVLLQVGYFKLTRKRIFKKAPIHHHFEMLGWKETRIVARFWITAIVLALLAQLWMRSG